MQHENLNFLFDIMTEFARLRSGPSQGNGEIAQVRGGRCGRKREHVGGGIEAAKFAIQAAQLGVAGNQATKWLPFSNFALQAAGETLRGSATEFRRRAAEGYGTAIG